MPVYENPAGFFESVSAVTATNTVDVGTRRYYEGKEYVYVYNNGNSQISVGNGATVSALTGMSVTVSSVTSVSPCVGVCHHATLTTGTYGWLVTKGPGVNLTADADTGLAVADNAVLGTDGVVTRVTGATGYKAPVFAYVTDATASGGTGKGVVHCWSA